MENMDKGLTVPNWVLIFSSAENTPNDPKIFSPICLPKHKSLGFLKKKLSLGVHSPCMKSLSLQGPRDSCAKVKFHQRTINKTLFGIQSFFCSAKVQAAKKKSYDFFSEFTSIFRHCSDTYF